jgi:PhnB protein
VPNRPPSIFAYICVDGASGAIDFYKRAFGAVERCRLPVSPDGPLGHAELQIGGAVLFLADEYPQNNWLAPPHLAGTSASLVLAVNDCDAAIQRALDAGATLERPVAEGHDGRGGWIIDPFGHRWNIMTPAADFEAHRHE